jgi:hypothetical protein
MNTLSGSTSRPSCASRRLALADRDRRVVPRDGAHLALLLAEVLQREEHEHRADERAEQRERADDAGQLAAEGRKPSPLTIAPGQRQQQGQPGEGLDALHQPCSSRSSSTSTGRRRRYIATMTPRPDRDLAGRDDHDDDRHDLAVAVAVHAAERDEREVRRVEHQLEAEQDDQRVALGHARRRRPPRR